MSPTHRPDGQGTRGRSDRSDSDETPSLTVGSRDPLKELYAGRWQQLPTLHKIAIVVALSLMSVFAGVFLVVPLTHAEGWSRLVEIVATVAGFLACLLVFRAILVRMIRYSKGAGDTAANNLNGPATKKR
jgi:hypothetical protein